jgi:hypothetical protein
MVCPFVPQLKVRQATQFFINERQQRIESFAAAIPPTLPQLRDRQGTSS